MIEIIVAIIGAVATIAAVIITGRANHRTMLEEQIKVANHRIDDLERSHQ